MIGKVYDLLFDFAKRLVSRKWLVWVFATHMTYTGLLDSASWMNISLLYIGIETTLDWTLIKNKQTKEIEKDE